MAYDFNITYNGITLSPANGFTVQEIEGIHNPDMRISREDLTGLDGGNIWARLYGMRGISISGIVDGTDADDFFANQRALIRAFNKDSDDWFVVTLWNGESKRIRAKAIQLPEMPMQEARVTFSTFRVEVLAEDPYWRDTSEEEYTATLSQPVGLAIPFILPAIMGSSDNSNIITINNTGDIDVYPYVKVSGAVDTAVVVNITTGEQFSISGEIDSGSYVELEYDQSGKSVLKDGTEKYWNNLIGNFIRIQPGVNQIQFSAATYSAEATLLITYSNKYESIQ